MGALCSLGGVSQQNDMTTHYYPNNSRFIELVPRSP